VALGLDVDVTAGRILSSAFVLNFGALVLNLLPSSRKPCCAQAGSRPRARGFSRRPAPVVELASFRPF
jgi:hypothetical protein